MNTEMIDVVNQGQKSVASTIAPNLLLSISSKIAPLQRCVSDCVHVHLEGSATEKTIRCSNSSIYIHISGADQSTCVVLTLRNRDNLLLFTKLDFVFSDKAGKMIGHKVVSSGLLSIMNLGETIALPALQVEAVV